MLSRTPAFDTAVRNGAQVTVAAEVRRAGVTLMSLNLDPGATVAFDETVASVRTFSGSVPDPGGLTPHTSADALAPYGNELAVSVGITTSPGVVEYVPAGVYRFNVSEADAFGHISIAGVDRSSVIAWARNEAPVTFTAGTTLASAIGQYIHLKYPTMPYNPAPSASLVTLGDTVIFLEGSQGSGDPWADCQSMAKTYGHWLYVDALGSATLIAVPQPPYNTVVWDYSPGPGNLAIPGSHRMDTSPSGQPSYNVAVVTAAGPNVTVPVTASAEITDPTAATYPNPATFGRRPVFFSSPLLITVDQCLATAQTLLASKQGASENIAFSAVPHPAHEPGDICHYASDQLGVEATVALSAWTLQLDLMAVSAYRTRSLAVATRPKPSVTLPVNVFYAPTTATQTGRIRITASHQKAQSGRVRVAGIPPITATQTGRIRVAATAADTYTDPYLGSY